MTMSDNDWYVMCWYDDRLTQDIWINCLSASSNDPDFIARNVFEEKPIDLPLSILESKTLLAGLYLAQKYDPKEGKFGLKIPHIFLVNLAQSMLV